MPKTISPKPYRGQGLQFPRSAIFVDKPRNVRARRQFECRRKSPNWPDSAGQLVEYPQPKKRPSSTCAARFPARSKSHPPCEPGRIESTDTSEHYPMAIDPVTELARF